MIKRLLVLFLAPVVGGAIGLLLAFVLQSGWLRPWWPVALPPEPPAAIRAVSDQGLWVVSPSGRLYFNSAPDTCLADCWAEVEGVVEPPPNKEVRRVLPHTCVTPPPLLGAVETVGQCQVGVWVDYNIAYARRSNGSLLGWQYWSGGEYGPLVYLLFPLIGAVVFFVLALLLILVLALLSWLRRRRAAPV